MGHGRNEPWIILIVRMHHDYNVRPSRQGQAIAAFLIAPIPQIAVMPVHKEAQLPSLLHGLIGAAIIHHDDVVHDLAVQSLNRLFQRLRRIVRGHDHRNFLRMNHSRASLISCANIVTTSSEAWPKWRPCQPFVSGNRTGNYSTGVRRPSRRMRHPLRKARARKGGSSTYFSTNTRLI